MFLSLMGNGMGPICFLLKEVVFEMKVPRRENRRQTDDCVLLVDIQFILFVLGFQDDSQCNNARKRMPILCALN